MDAKLLSWLLSEHSCQVLSSFEVPKANGPFSPVAFVRYPVSWVLRFLGLRIPWQYLGGFGQLKTALWVFTLVSFGLGTLKCAKVT